VVWWSKKKVWLLRKKIPNPPKFSRPFKKMQPPLKKFLDTPLSKLHENPGKFSFLK